MQQYRCPRCQWHHVVEDGVSPRCDICHGELMCVECIQTFAPDASCLPGAVEVVFTKGLAVSRGLGRILLPIALVGAGLLLATALQDFADAVRAHTAELQRLERRAEDVARRFGME